MRCLDIGLLVILFLPIPLLAYRFGYDSLEGIESDGFERRGSRGG
jgi:hypothetical protein